MATQPITPDDGGGGSGPGGHPGVVMVDLTQPPDSVIKDTEAALSSGGVFLFTYSRGDEQFAVFASNYGSH